jgi:hypothetical protein
MSFASMSLPPFPISTTTRTAPGAKRKSEDKTTSSATKRQRVSDTIAALRKVVKDYCREDDLIRAAELQLKPHKKRREELRQGITKALKTSDVPACKVPSTATDQVPLHLRLKVRKSISKPKKDELQQRMRTWLVAKGLPESAGDEIYQHCFANPKDMVEKVSLCRIKPTKPRANRAKNQAAAALKKPRVLMLTAEDTSDDDDDSDSGSSSSDSGSGSDSE